MKFVDSDKEGGVSVLAVRVVKPCRHCLREKRIALYLRFGSGAGSPDVVYENTPLKRHAERTCGVVPVDDHRVNAVSLPHGRFAVKVGACVRRAERHFRVAGDIDPPAVAVFDAVESGLEKFLARHIDRLPERTGSGIVENLRAEDNASILVVRHSQRGSGRFCHGFLGFGDKGIHFALVHAEEFAVLRVLRAVGGIPFADRGENHLLLRGFAGVVGLLHRVLYLLLDHRVNALEFVGVLPLVFPQAREHIRLPLRP